MKLPHTTVRECASREPEVFILETENLLAVDATGLRGLDKALQRAKTLTDQKAV